MEKQELNAVVEIRFDYATYDIKKIMATMEKVNEVLVGVDPLLEDKSKSARKKAMFPNFMCSEG